MGRSYHSWSSDKIPSQHKKIRQQVNEREAMAELTSVVFKTKKPPKQHRVGA